MLLDIKSYQPGRFSYLMKEDFTNDLWGFLSNKIQINKMIKATKEGLPAIKHFLDDLENQFQDYLESEKYPAEEVAIFANNMIKHIMENYGYIHSACGICPTAKYVKTSGIYTPLASQKIGNSTHKKKYFNSALQYLKNFFNNKKLNMSLSLFDCNAKYC